MRRGALMLEQAYAIQREAEDLLHDAEYEVDSLAVLELALADAILDRLLTRAERIALKGESLRPARVRDVAASDATLA